MSLSDVQSCKNNKINKGNKFSLEKNVKMRIHKHYTGITREKVAAASSF